MRTAKEAKQLTIYEYSLLLKSVELKEVDKEYARHRQAWVNQQAKATKKKGKDIVPYFDNFKQFFDYEKQVNEILRSKKKEKKLSNLEKLMLQANS